jgi:hypothetical protein
MGDLCSFEGVKCRAPRLNSAQQVTDLKLLTQTAQWYYPVLQWTMFRTLVMIFQTPPNMRYRAYRSEIRVRRHLWAVIFVEATSVGGSRVPRINFKGLNLTITVMKDICYLYVESYMSNQPSTSINNHRLYDLNKRCGGSRSLMVSTQKNVLGDNKSLEGGTCLGILH